MGKLLVDEHEIIRVLSALVKGFSSLKIIAIDNLNSLDCSSLPAEPHSKLLQEDLQNIYIEYLRQLQLSASEASKNNNDQFFKNLDKQKSIFKKLELIEESQKKTSTSNIINGEAKLHPYSELLSQAYMGLKECMRLAELHFDGNKFSEETNSGKRLIRVQQKLNQSDVDPIVIEGPAHGIASNILEKANSIINKYYKFLLQQAKEPFAEALNLFNSHDFDKHTKGADCLQAIAAAKNDSEKIDYNQRACYFELLEQKKVEVRKRCIKQSAGGKSLQELLLEFEEAKKKRELLIKINQQVQDGQNIQVLENFKNSLHKAIIENREENEIAKIMLAMLVYARVSDGDDSSGQELGKMMQKVIIMLKTVIIWSLNQRKILATKILLDVGRANGIELFWPLPYSAGWSLLHEIAQFIPKNDNDLEKQQLIEVATSLIQELLISVDIRDKAQGTSLFYAANAGNALMVDFLLAHKAEVNAPNMLGFTALHEAARNGHDQVITRLIQQPGINLNAVDSGTEDNLLDITKWQIFVISAFCESGIAKIKGNAVVLTNDNEVYFLEEGSIVKTDSHINKSVSVTNRDGIAMTSSVTPDLVASNAEIKKFVYEVLVKAELIMPIFVISTFSEVGVANITGNGVVLTNDNKVYFLDEGSIVKANSHINKSVSVINRGGIAMTSSVTSDVVAYNAEVTKFVYEVLAKAELITPNYTNNEATALHYASFHGHIGVVKQLLDARARTDIEDRFSNTAYDWAKVGLLELRNKLARQDKIDQQLAIIQLLMPASVRAKPKHQLSINLVPAPPCIVTKERREYIDEFMDNKCDFATFIMYYRAQRPTNKKIIDVCTYLLCREKQLQFFGRKIDYITSILSIQAKELYLKSDYALNNDYALLKKEMSKNGLPLLTL